MARLLPVERGELIQRLRQLGFGYDSWASATTAGLRLRQLGFEGPFEGGRHQFMLRGDCRLIVPNPHAGDISVGLVRRIIRRAGITRDEWLGSS